MEFYGFIVLSGLFGVFLLFYTRSNTREEKKKKGKGEKEDSDTDSESDSSILSSIVKEMQIKCSMNSMEIHKLYLENCELRNKLDKIYANHLNENINYYKNIVLMNEKIEYMQKYLLHKSCSLQEKNNHLS
jgi:hypothetical protein